MSIKSKKRTHFYDFHYPSIFTILSVYLYYNKKNAVPGLFGYVLMLYLPILFLLCGLLQTALYEKTERK